MKKNLFKTSMISVAAAVVIAMTGCGGGGGSSSSGSSSSSSSGSASDGYISGATVCIDMNNDGNCTQGTSGDIFGSDTDDNGYYSLVIPAGTKTNAKTPLLVVGGTDVDTNETLEGTLKAPFGTGRANITPLTTMAAAMVASGDVTDATEAFKKVANILGIDESLVNADPASDEMKEKHPEVFAKAMTIHRVVLSMVSAAGDNVSDIYGKLAKAVANNNGKGNGVGDLMKAAKSTLTGKALEIAKSDVASKMEGLIAAAVKEGNETKFKDVAKETVTTYVKNVADAAKTGVDIDANVSTLVKNTVATTIAADKTILNFGNTFRITKGDGTNYDVNLTDTLDTAMFKNDVDMNISDNADIKDFNITLAGMDVNQSFTDANASLNVTITDEFNTSNYITISVPTVVIKYNDVNETNLTIQAGEKVNLTSYGNINIDNAKKSISDDSNTTFAGNDGNLTIALSKLLSNINTTKLNNYLTKSRSYTVSVQINDINNTNLFVPFTEVKGQVNVNKAKLSLGDKIVFTNGNETNSTTFSDGTFDNLVNINVSDDSHLSDFNITLANLSISGDFSDVTDANTSLTFEIDDQNKSENKISLKIETVNFAFPDDSNFSTIPAGTKITFIQEGDVNITNSDNVTKTISRDLVLDGDDDNLTISLNDLLGSNGLDLSTEEKDNLNNYLDTNRTYSVSVRMSDFNDSKILVPNKSISGQIKVTNN